MKLWPEDRRNQLAARLLSQQPDPPRTVTLGQMAGVYILLLGALLIPADLISTAVLVGGRSAPLLASVGVLGTALIALGWLQGIGRTRSALQFGVAATGKVTAVAVGIRAARLTTVRVEASAVVTDTTVTRGGADEVLEPGDVVQVMIDPRRTRFFWSWACCSHLPCTRRHAADVQ